MLEQLVITTRSAVASQCIGRSVLGCSKRSTPRAIGIELTAAGDPVRTREALSGAISWRAALRQHLDFVVGDQIVLEIKSVEQLAPCTTRRL